MYKIVPHEQLNLSQIKKSSKDVLRIIYNSYEDINLSKIQCSLLNHPFHSIHNSFSLIPLLQFLPPIIPSSLMFPLIYPIHHNLINVHFRLGVVAPLHRFPFKTLSWPRCEFILFFEPVICETDSNHNVYIHQYHRFWH